MQRDQAHRTNELLERIAIALEKNNKNKSVTHADIHNAKYNNDIPGFEGTLDALDVLADIKTITDEYASKENLTNMTEARDYYKEKFENTLTPTSDNPDPAGYGNEDERCDCGNELEDKDVICESCEDETHHEYTYETDLQGIRVDSDHDIRSTAHYYTEVLDNGNHRDLKTKKDCILDYVTNEFGLHGARYTDIIKFAYYLNGPNKPKYTSEDRGYYACAFATRYGGHLIQGGEDQLVKGINNEGKERYFTLSEVDNFTGFWKYIK